MNGDTPISTDQLDTIPPDGSTVYIRVMPGQKVAQAVADVAAVVTAVGIAVMGVGIAIAAAPVIFAGFLIAGIALSVAVAAGITISAMNAYEALIPDLTTGGGGGGASDTLPGVRGGSNRMNPWGAVPVILGEMLVTPSYAAGPYTEISGADGVDQYLMMLFVVGYAPLKITNIKIGDSLIATNSADQRNGTIVSDGIFSGVELEIRESAGSMTLYPYICVEEQPNAELQCPSGSPSVMVRTTPPNTTNISVDIAFNYGLIGYGDGNTPKNATVEVYAEYKLSSDTTWNSLGVWDGVGSTVITKQSSKTIRYTMSKSVTAGQYDVRLKRVTADSTDVSVRDKVSWLSFRSFKSEDPVVNQSDVVRLALKIKATDQLNGVLNKVSMIAESVVPVYSGSGSGASSWTSTAVSRNPAALLMSVLRGVFNPRVVPDSKMDWSTLESWYTYCAAKPFNCDSIIDRAATMKDILTRIAGVGRATLAMRDGKYSVVVDDVRPSPVQVFTPRNSRDFKGTKSYPEVPHCLKLSFVNAAKDYAQDECLVYDDGYNEGNATKFESFDLWGVTSYEQAWRQGRYMIAAYRLRPEVFEITVDVEHIVCTRGDWVLVTHDIPMWGIGSGRIKALTVDGSNNVTSITTDEAFLMENGKSYSATIRTDAALILTIPVVTNIGTQTTLVFSSPISAASGVKVGDMVAFGETMSVTTDCIIVGISIQDDLSANVSLVEYAPAIFTSDTGTIPSFDSKITKRVPPITDGYSIIPPVAPQMGDPLPFNDPKILSLSVTSALRSRMNAITPDTLTITAMNQDKSAYSGRFTIELSHDGMSFQSPVYTSSSDQSSYTYTIPATMVVSSVTYFVMAIRVKLYMAGGTTTLCNQGVCSVSADPLLSPCYWGALTSAPASGFISGDYYWDNNTPASDGGKIRYYNGTSWAEMLSSNPLYYTAWSSAMIDARLWAVANSTAIPEAVKMATATAQAMAQKQIVDALPANPYTGYSIGDFVVLTTDKKLYRLTSTSLPGATGWTAAVDGNDVSNLPITSLASGLRPPRVVSSLPVSPFTGYAAGDTVVLTTDNKLYRFTGTDFTKAVDGSDIVADSITAAQIATGAITADELAANAVTAVKILAGAISADKLDVLVRNRVNSFVNSLDGTNGWSLDSGCTIVTVDGLRTLRAEAPNCNFSSSPIEVLPDEILAFTFALQCPNYTTGSGLFLGLTDADTYEGFYYNWPTMQWISDGSGINRYFVNDFKSTGKVKYKTYILGSNVDISLVPAPDAPSGTTIYCLKLQAGKTSTTIHTGYNTTMSGTYWYFFQPQVKNIDGGKVIASNIMAGSITAAQINVGDLAANAGFYNALTATNAFIQSLMAKYLQLQTGGAIYSGGYDQSGNNPNNLPGVYINAGGTMMANQISVKNSTVQGTSVNINFAGSWIYGTWGSESVVNSANYDYTSLAVLPDGRVLCLYRRGSDGYQVQRIRDTSGTWGSETLVTSVALTYSSLAVLPDGRVLFVYRRNSTGYLVQIIRDTSGIWGGESVVNDEGSYTPSLAVLPDGRVLCVYRRSPDNYLVQIIRDTSGTWGSKSVVNSASSDYSSLAVLTDGSVLCVYKRNSDSYMVQRIRDTSGTWGSESVVNGASSDYSSLAVLPDGRALFVYRRNSDSYIVQRIRDTSGTWGSESVVNSSNAWYPSLAVLLNGSVLFVYRRSSDNYLVQRLDTSHYTSVPIGSFPVQLGAGLIEVGENSNGIWIKISDGTMVCFGTITYSSTAARFTSITKTLPTSYIKSSSFIVHTWLNIDISVNSTINWSQPVSVNTWNFQETALDAVNLTAVTKTAYYIAIGRYQ
jgi:hypothetical protein